MALCFSEGVWAAPFTLEGAAVFLPSLAVLGLYFCRPGWGLCTFVLLRTVADAIGELSVPLLGFSWNAASCLGVAVILLGLINARKFSRRKAKLVLPFVVLLIVVLYETALGWGTLGSRHFPEMLREMARLFAVPCFVISLLALERKEDLAVLKWCFFICIVICGVWGALQLALGGGVYEATSGVRRATGPFAFPNTLGYVLLLGINVLLGGLLFSERRQRRRALPKRAGEYALLLVLLGFLSLTASFTLFALLILSVLIFFVLKRKFAVLGIVFLLFAASAPLFLPRLEMIAGSSVSADLKAGSAGNTLTSRLCIWRSLLRKYRERPVLGWGLRSVPKVNPLLNLERGLGSEPHNDLILFLFEGGLLGLCGFMAFHVSALIVAGGLAEKAYRKGREIWVCGIWVTCVCMLAGSLVNNLLSFTAFLFLFWGWVAVCANSIQRVPED